MGMVYVFLADGFEEVEALTAVDILRRAELEVRTVGIGGREVSGVHPSLHPHPLVTSFSSSLLVPQAGLFLTI